MEACMLECFNENAPIYDLSSVIPSHALVYQSFLPPFRYVTPNQYLPKAYHRSELGVCPKTPLRLQKAGTGTAEWLKRLFGSGIWSGAWVYCVAGLNGCILFECSCVSSCVRAEETPAAVQGDWRRTMNLKTDRITSLDTWWASQWWLIITRWDLHLTLPFFLTLSLHLSPFSPLSSPK